MAKSRKTTAGAAIQDGATKVNKSAAIRDYLSSHRDAKPKEVVAALKEQGIDVSPNVVSIVKAKTKIKAARRGAKRAAAAHEAGAADRTKQAGGLDAALTLYKAAQGQEVPSPKVRSAFLTLVELLG
jgi:hypothetical protein